MSKGIKFLAVLAIIGIFTIAFTTLSFAQSEVKKGDQTQGPTDQTKPASSFGQKLGVQGSNPSGDLSKNTQGAPGQAKPASSFGQKLGVQGSNPSGDLATNSSGKPGQPKPASSFGQKLGVQGSNPSGDLATNTDQH